jgi:hypothetical protein
MSPSDRRHAATVGGTRRQSEWDRAAYGDGVRHHPTRRIGSPQTQGAGSIPVPPALENPEFMGLELSWLQPSLRATPTC